MCLSGTTASRIDAAAWGAQITLGLNVTASGEAPYNATSHGVKGFRVSLSGQANNFYLRVGFKDSLSGANPVPFVVLAATSGTYEATIADALVPSSWNVPNAGAHPDPTSLLEVQIQLVPMLSAQSFDLCVTSLSPILQ